MWVALFGGKYVGKQQRIYYKGINEEVSSLLYES